MSEIIRKVRRQFDRQCKDDAVALVRSGRPQAPVARDLGVTPGVLSEWVQKAAAGHALSPSKALAALSPEQRELQRLRHENDYLRQQRDILKKSLGHLVGRGARARFTVMEKLRPPYPAGALAEALEVSKSGFYAHQLQARRPRRQRDAELQLMITASFARSRQTYGCRRIRADLAAAGQRCGKARGARLLRQGAPAPAPEAPLPPLHDPEPPRALGA